MVSSLTLWQTGPSTHHSLEASRTRSLPIVIVSPGSHGRVLSLRHAHRRPVPCGAVAGGVVTQAEIDTLGEGHPPRTGERPLVELLTDDGQIAGEELDAHWAGRWRPMRMDALPPDAWRNLDG